MKQMQLDNLDKTLYYETLENGLEIYLLPYEDKKNYFITYATRYGSDILKFEKDEEMYKPPLGIAHYLEHKMFEEENKEDPFTFFSYSGTDGNASTSYDNTQYICYGTKCFEENLRFLLTFVNEPYFTDENVEKEKGIIAEEIKMYNDMPDYQLEMKLRENLYYKSPRKYDIAGTVSEINKITKEDLYNCYNSFYVPNNMFIIITGNFNIDKALTIIKECLEEKEKQPLPKIEYEVDKKEVVKEEEVIYKEIEIPKIAVGIKVPKKSISLKNIEKDLYLSMLTTILFGSSSEFRERVRNSKILNDIYTEWEEEHSYQTFYLLATTTSPDELLDEINYELTHISISKNTFERIKKVWIANEVKMIDSIERTQNNLFDDMIRYKKVITNRISIIKKMNIKTLESLLDTIDLSHKSILKMLKKEDENK